MCHQDHMLGCSGDLVSLLSTASYGAGHVLRCGLVVDFRSQASIQVPPAGREAGGEKSALRSVSGLHP